MLLLLTLLLYHYYYYYYYISNSNSNIRIIISIFNSSIMIELTIFFRLCIYNLIIWFFFKYHDRNWLWFDLPPPRPVTKKDLAAEVERLRQQQEKIERNLEQLVQTQGRSEERVNYLTQLEICFAGHMGCDLTTATEPVPISLRTPCDTAADVCSGDLSGAHPISSSDYHVVSTLTLYFS